jgi:hypothetical protein
MALQSRAQLLLERATSVLPITIEVETVATQGELIEDYPEDARGHSCLLLGFGEGGRPIHAVCSPKDDYLAIITAYLPDPAQWSRDFKRRLYGMYPL